MADKTEPERNCAYCEKSSPICESDYCLCRLRGAVPAGYMCKKFSFDPFKLSPRLTPPLPAIDPEELAT